MLHKSSVLKFETVCQGQCVNRKYFAVIFRDKFWPKFQQEFSPKFQQEFLPKFLFLTVVAMETRNQIFMEIGQKLPKEKCEIDTFQANFSHMSKL